MNAVVDIDDVVGRLGHQLFPLVYKLHYELRFKWPSSTRKDILAFSAMNSKMGVSSLILLGANAAFMTFRTRR